MGEAVIVGAEAAAVEADYVAWAEVYAQPLLRVMCEEVASMETPADGNTRSLRDEDIERFYKYIMVMVTMGDWKSMYPDLRGRGLPDFTTVPFLGAKRPGRSNESAEKEVVQQRVDAAVAEFGEGNVFLTTLSGEKGAWTRVCDLTHFVLD